MVLLREGRQRAEAAALPAKPGEVLAWQPGAAEPFQRRALSLV